MSDQTVESLTEAMIEIVSHIERMENHLAPLRKAIEDGRYGPREIAADVNLRLEADFHNIREVLIEHGTPLPPTKIPKL